MTSTRGSRFKSPIEAAVRHVLVERRLDFREQFRIGPYRADFFLPAYNVVLECDGFFWHSRPGAVRKDRARDAFMRRRGYTVVRMSGRSIRQNARETVSRALRGVLLPRRRPPGTPRGRAPRLKDHEEV